MQQMARDRQDARLLVDASWVLRRLTDQTCPDGSGTTLYAMCELLDRAASTVDEVELGVRGCLLKVARSIQHDARLRGADDG